MTFDAVVTLIGRALLAFLFILAGLAKILGPQPFLDHMAHFGVPSLLLPPVIALEIGAGIALLAGWHVRYAAGALAVFCVVAAIMFHHELAIKAERTLLLKDIALAGALMVIAVAPRRSA